MKKILFFCLFLLTCSITNGQDNKIYIDRGSFTKVLSISPITHHGDAILTVNVFQQKVDQEIPWGEATTIVTYRYLGIDAQNNLHLEREETSEYVGDNNSNLIFGLNSTNSDTLTLIGQRAQKDPLLIKLKVEASNNQISSKYLGDLNLFKD
jgi:hypothetical protein